MSNFNACKNCTNESICKWCFCYDIKTSQVQKMEDEETNPIKVSVTCECFMPRMEAAHNFKIGYSCDIGQS